jgi:hypothetical protein
MQLNDRKEAFSLAYVKALCATVGCTVSSWSVDDDSVDLTLKRPGSAGVIPSPMLDIQLKATARPAVGRTGVSFPLKTKNFEDLRQPSHYPRILVVVTLPGDDVRQWVEHVEEERFSLISCAYWACLEHLEDNDNTASTTVKLERQLTADVLGDLMDRISDERPLEDVA